MIRQSFAAWRLPRALDGVLLFEDLSAGRSRFLSTERHFHEELELHFIERGHCLLLLRDRRLQAPAGSLLWVPPGRDHLLLDASADLRRWLLLVRRRAVRRVLPAAAAAELLRRDAGERGGLLTARAAASIRAVYQDVRARFDGALPLVNAAIGYALARSYLHFQDARPSAEGAEFHPAVRRALAALREVVPPPSLGELAHRCRLSEAHLSKLFSAQVGMSVTDFRNRMRLERFLELYGDGRGRTLLSAALDAGFGSYPQFHRVFRELMGYAPAEHARR
jgi:AraC-like DNA-binding protein